MNSLSSVCPFCEAVIEFGEYCDCLEQKQKKIHRLHKEAMRILQHEEGGTLNETEN